MFIYFNYFLVVINMKNQNIAFMLKKKELDHISTEQERIKILKELINLNPKDPRDLELRTKFKKELLILENKSFGKKSISYQNIYDSIKHNRQVVILGETNSGKSTLLEKLTDSHPIILETPFTTYKPESGIFLYNDVPIQLIEIPSLYEGDNDKNKINFIRNADIICILIKNHTELNPLISILENYLIIPSKEISEAKNHKHKSREEIIEKPSFIAAWTKFDYVPCNVVDISSLTEFGYETYRLLNIMRIYCFKNGKIDGNPVVFSKWEEPTVTDFANKLGLKNFKYAKIFENKNDNNGKLVGLDYKLKEGDLITLK